MKLTPIALALSSSFLWATPLASHAADNGPISTNGENGSNTFSNGNFILIGGASYGLSGSYEKRGAVTTGENSDAVNGRSVLVVGAEVVGGSGSAGKSNSNGGGGGGAGGFGGASIFGGISIAGNGGDNYYGTSNAGNSGSVSRNSVILESVILKGFMAHGGAGGGLLGQGGSDGAGGAGGQGGGSVFGGLSVGGNGGNSFFFSPSVGDPSATGGNAGNASSNTIVVRGSGHFEGGDGGRGGHLAGTDGSGGAGGHGGASIFGGMSIGGSSGNARSGTSSSALTGSAGNANDNELTLENLTLIGGQGGVGGTSSYYGGSSGALGGSGGFGGFGGASVFGGISIGGNGGSGYLLGRGDSGDTSNNTISILGTSVLTGKAGGAGGGTTYDTSNLAEGGGSGGAGGHGGASVFGGISIGGAAGATAKGGSAGVSSSNSITLENITLNAAFANGGAGGDVGGTNNSSAVGAGGLGGMGGGSVFGGVSIGGNGGTSDWGGGNAASQNTITIRGASALHGGEGGIGGSVKTASLGKGGSGGSGGYGGGSVFGGISMGGNAGNGTSTSNGGSSGVASNNTISISTTTLSGGKGGDGGNLPLGAAGFGGHGGGSVFGGISTGGAGGVATSTALGGTGGDASNNSITLNDVKLFAGDAGNGGSSQSGLNGFKGLAGGSVFGGVSLGGGGGYIATGGDASGGHAGNASYNKILITGDSKIEGDIYGGYSRGGAQGIGAIAAGGKGGMANNNTVTLIGDSISIGGSLYGGLSLDNGVSPNGDSLFNSYYAGNTLAIQRGHIAVKGIENFQKYKWLLPQNEFDGDTIVSIDPVNGTPVNLQNTMHSVDVDAEGNTLHAGDTVVLIDRVTGTPQTLSRSIIEQGFFIVYDAEMLVEPNQAVAGTEQLVLKVLGKKDDGIPDGKLNPESEAFLKGRVAQLAMVDQGADMISDGIWSARASLREKNSNLFIVVDGGSNRYKTDYNSHIKLNDAKFAAGAAHAFTMNDQSIGMVGVFAEHGNGNYNSYNDLGSLGEIHGNGKTRYNGVGALFHVDLANTDVSKVKNKPNIFDSKYGLYAHGALRVGHAKVDFRSADLVNGNGVEGSYNTKSRYVTAMIGAGYVLTLDERKAVDFYGRYSFSRLNAKDVQVVNEPMSVGAAHSHRLRLGARLGYAYSDKITPYAGVAYERNFSGDVSGSAYGFTIKEKSLKGSTGIVEAGVLVKPKGATDPLSLNFAIQGYGGQRKGATASIRARYVF